MLNKPACRTQGFERRLKHVPHPAGTQGQGQGQGKGKGTRAEPV